MVSPSLNVFFFDFCILIPPVPSMAPEYFQEQGAFPSLNLEFFDLRFSLTFPDFL